MPSPSDQRVCGRIRLELPLRVRQIGPPRDAVEVTRTVDRNGVLFRTRERYDLNTTVWVTMPYHPNAAVKDPEFPASIVRMDRAADGSTEVAVQFHSAHADYIRPVYQPTAAVPRKGLQERRAKNRVRMTLPIRVREGDQAEESVTLDVSRTGVLFRSVRSYRLGQQVWVSLAHQPGAPPQEVSDRVVRNIEKGPVRGVAIHFQSAAGFASTRSL